MSATRNLILDAWSEKIADRGLSTYVNHNWGLRSCQCITCLVYTPRCSGWGTPQETEELIRNDQEFPHLSEIDTSMVEPICEDRKKLWSQVLQNEVTPLVNESFKKSDKNAAADNDQIEKDRPNKSKRMQRRNTKAKRGLWERRSFRKGEKASHGKNLQIIRVEVPRSKKSKAGANGGQAEPFKIALHNSFETGKDIDRSKDVEEEFKLIDVSTLPQTDSKEVNASKSKVKRNVRKTRTQRNKMNRVADRAARLEIAKVERRFLEQLSSIKNIKRIIDTINTEEAQRKVAEQTKRGSKALEVRTGSDMRGGGPDKKSCDKKDGRRKGRGRQKGKKIGRRKKNSSSQHPSQGSAEEESSKTCQEDHDAGEEQVSGSCSAAKDSTPDDKEKRASRNRRYKEKAEGKKKTKDCKRLYNKTDKGKESKMRRNFNFANSPAGKKIIKDYESSPSGRSARLKATSKYQASSHGKPKQQEATSKYKASAHGSSVQVEAVRVSRMKPETAQKRKESDKRNKEKLSQSERAKYRRKKMSEELKDDSDDEIQFNLKRREAMFQIRNHEVTLGKKLRFQKNRKNVTKSRKSVFLPRGAVTARGGVKYFMRSRSRLQWRNAVIQSLKNSLTDEMTEQFIKQWFPTYNFSKRTMQYKKLFVSKHLQKKILNTRDLWIKVLYSGCHKLSLTAEQLLNQEELDTNEESERYFDKILGWKSHRKGSEPHFPLYSFKDGKSFEFKYDKNSKKSSEELRKSERCTRNCIPAEGPEVTRFKDFLEGCKDLDVRNSRTFVQDCNKCGNIKMNEMYLLLVDKRNHPESCIRRESKNKCTSALVLLRKLAVHYNNARTMYKIVNDMKVADQFVSDIDTATFLMDIPYLMKLLAYEPFLAAKTFEVERPSEVINEEYMEQTFGKHYMNFLHTMNALPEVVCISCQKLIEKDPKTCKTITARWKKVSQPGSEYSLLLQYLQSDAWVRKGGYRVDSLVDKHLCSYCHSKMEKGEVPRTSVRNNMDEGVTPKVITDLTPFESMFIRQVSMFQTFLKLGPSVGNRPNNEKMSAVKGFSVHIPVQVQLNVDQLAGKKAGLLNPRDFIVLHGIPTKDRKVWQSLINVGRILAALKWLVKNNTLYKDIKVPTENEILDMLCEIDSSGEEGVSANDFLDSFDGFSEEVENSSLPNVFSESSDATSPQVPHKRPCYTNTNTSEDIELSLPDVVPDDMKKDSTTLNGTNLEDEMDCEMSNSSVLSPNDDDSTELTMGSSSNEMTSDSNPSDDMDVVSSMQSCHSSDSEISVSLKAKDKGGREELISIKLSGIDCKTTELAVEDEDPSYQDLWKFSATLNEEEMKKVKMISSINSKRKYIAIRCITQMARMLQCNGSMCRRCNNHVRLGRERLISLLQHGKNTLGYQLCDTTSLMGMFGRMRAALLVEDDSIAKNSCAFCRENKISYNPFRQKAKRNSRGSFKPVSNSHQQRAHWGSGFFYQTRVKTFTILDSLKERAQICGGCCEELEDRCLKGISHFAKPSRSLTWKIKNRSTALYDLYCQVQGLSAKATLVQDEPLSHPTELHGICVKCDNHVTVNPDFLDIHFEQIELPTEKNNFEAYCTLGAKVMGKTELHCEEFPQIGESLGEERAARRSENEVYCNHIVHNICTALHQSLHCSHCEKNVKATAAAFKRHAEYKKPTAKSHSLNLEDCDTNVLRSLNVFYSERLSNSLILKTCFKCEKSLNSTLKGGAGISCDENDFDASSEDHLSDIDENISDIEVEEDEEKKEPRTMMEEMTAEDYQNLIEEYTVTGMDLLEDNPDLMDDLYKLLRIDDDPMEMENKDLDLLSFPEIFSWGVGGKRGFRSEEAKPLQYEKARLMSSRSNTRRNIQHLFYLAGEHERRKIRSSIFATLKNVNGMENLDAASLLNKIKSKDSALMKRINKVLRLVPNTQAYWESQRAKLKAQIEKFGPPTFFATFSPAEYDWEDLIQHLKNVNSDIPNLDELSPSALLNKDPVLVSTYIHKRFNALLKFIIEAEPLGKVKSHFIRHEYQSRGTVHFHTFLWIEGAPIIGENSDAEISSFVQKHVHCRLPNQVEEASLFDTVGNYQTHKCRPYCLRTFKGSKKGAPGSRKSKVACRFGFPRPKAKKFTLHDVSASVIARKTKKMRQRLYDLPRTEEERRINDYNPILSFLWRGNMDIQFLAEDSYSITEYVTKYITKGETSVIDMNDADLKDLSKTAYQNFSKFAFQLLKSREMGAHEASDRILQNSGELWRSSENFVWVPTTTPDRRSRVMKNLSVLENQRPDSTNIFFDDWVHTFYPNRPRTEDFENMTLYDFVSKYEKVVGKLGKDKADAKGYIKIVDENGRYIRTMQLRRKEPVIYHYNYSIRSDPELFYYSMLFLYKPWRKEDDIAGQHSTYGDAFFDAVDDHAQLKEKSGRKINIEKARARMEKEAEERMENPVGTPSTQPEDVLDASNLRAGLRDFEMIQEKSEIRSTEELESFIDSLNEDQRRVFNTITVHLEHVFLHMTGKCTDKKCKKPLFLYVSGFGGTGKSYLIKALQGYLWVQKNLFDEPADIALTAPTGLAAANIGGLTLHSLFNLPVEHGEALPKYSALKQNSIQQTRTVFRDLALLVIDEISMVSAEMLLSINLRMQEIFGADEIFGGKSVIVFGDLLQLPPVHGKHPFEELSGDDVHNLTRGLRISSHLWENFLFDELTINQRQSGIENLLWSSMLGRLRIGRHTPEDIKKLEQRLIPIRNCGNPREYLEQIVESYLALQKQHPSTVCLLPKRNMMEAFNTSVMKNLFPNAVSIKTHDYVDGPTEADRKRGREAVAKIDKLGDSRNTADLEESILLCEGVRIMLRKNLDTGRGLVNGAMGTVTEVTYPKDYPKSPVERLLVRFDGIDEDVTILRDSRKVKIFENCFLHRRQFPVSVGYALTIHKAQGMSLSHVFCDLGASIFATGQIYVALSRCKSLEGLQLVNFDQSKIKVDRLAINEYIRLRSRPIAEAGITSDKDITDPSKKGKRKKRGCSERIWYETDTSKKAKATVKENVNAQDGSKAKKRKQKGPAKKKKSATPAQPANTSSLNANNMNAFIHRIHVFVPAEYIPTTDVIIGEDIRLVYRGVLIPCYRPRPLDTFMNRAGIELDPDPFNERRPESLWLSAETIAHYITVLQDDLIEAEGLTNVTMYNLGPYCANYKATGRRCDQINLRNFVNESFAQRPYTRLSRRRVVPFTIRSHITSRGDPMQHDVIVTVGNPGDHWYAIIIDNRTKQVVHFDSIRRTTKIWGDRCRDHLTLLSDFRQYLRTTVNMDIDESLTTDEYELIDGGSSPQRNGHDCGVFTLMNIEKHVTGKPNNHPIIQSLMGLYRLRVLSKLYKQSIAQGTGEGRL